MLVAGGEGTTGFLSSAELYNPSTGRWSATGSMATSRLGQSAALLPNGLVLVAGGIVNISDTGVVAVTASAELYNPSTGQWTPTGSRHSAAARRPGAGCGWRQPYNGTLASVELYTP